MATTMCEIDGHRPAVATVRIRQNGDERTIAVCEEHLLGFPVVRRAHGERRTREEAPGERDRRKAEATHSA